MQLVWDYVHSLHHICTVSTKYYQNRLSELSSTKVSLRSNKRLSKEYTVFSPTNMPGWLQAHVLVPFDNKQW